MGTINYCINKYITLGLNVSEYIKKYFCEKESNFGIEYCLINYYDELQEIINKYNFEHFKIELRPGYYEGFYIYIDDYDYIFLDNTKEKNEFLKEITKLKKLLIELVENGLVACFPGWCTSYLSKEKSKKEIKEAIKQFKEDIKKIPTYKIFKINGGFKQWQSVNQ